MSEQKICQTVDFYMDWQVIEVFKVFNNLNGKKRISQEDLLRKAGLNHYALNDAFIRIKQKIKDCIVTRPEYDGLELHQKVGKAMGEWLQAEYDFMFRGRLRMGVKRTSMYYQLAPNIEIIELREDNVVLRVYKNAN